MPTGQAQLTVGLSQLMLVTEKLPFAANINVLPKFERSCLFLKAR